MFDGKMWVIGGTVGTQQRSDIWYSNDVWYSTDGVDWTQATPNAAWSPRAYHTSVVYDDKMWVIGGVFDQTQSYNDVWYSSDGVDWIQTTANAAWLPRSAHTSVVYDGRMWVIGGSIREGLQSRGITGEVWYSTDGVNWTMRTALPGWGDRFLHTSVVYDGKMWVIGGLDSSNPHLGAVWYSTNGWEWIPAVKSLRGVRGLHHASVVFDDKMWVIGGDDGAQQLSVRFITGPTPVSATPKATPAKTPN